MIDIYWLFIYWIHVNCAVAYASSNYILLTILLNLAARRNRLTDGYHDHAWFELVVTLTHSTLFLTDVLILYLQFRSSLNRNCAVHTCMFASAHTYMFHRIWRILNTLVEIASRICCRRQPRKYCYYMLILKKHAGNHVSSTRVREWLVRLV